MTRPSASRRWLDSPPLEAFWNVLKRREVLWKTEVLEEIRQLREKAVKAR